VLSREEQFEQYAIIVSADAKPGETIYAKDMMPQANTERRRKLMKTSRGERRKFPEASIGWRQIILKADEN
jgi:hypothetical protein